MNNRKNAILILCADDDKEDQMLVEDALEECKLGNSLLFVDDGQALMDYLNKCKTGTAGAEYVLPGLILLDLNMPRKDGREALAEIKSDPILRRVPVCILTTSDADQDIMQSYDLGVNSYVRKPVSFDGLVEKLQAMGKYWFEIVTNPIDRN